MIWNKWTNRVMTALYMGGMILLLGLLGLLIAGTLGLFVLTGLFVFSMSMIARLPAWLVLRMQGARPLNPYRHPTIHRLTAWLAQRAGLSHVPALYLIPGSMQNALTMGTESSAVVAVTEGFLGRFSDRELAGILAHEISHIKNRDTFVMGLAATTSRFTTVLSQIGFFLLFINLPLVLAGYVVIPWLLILLLLFAPSVSTLLTLGLSRTREYKADLDAAALTGDPQGLAFALQRIEQYRRPWWERIFMPMRREPQSTWLRTHPPTDERIRRLLELKKPEALVFPYLPSRSLNRLKPRRLVFYRGI
ncbi:MAG: M48 family metalloprotease [Planctomycetes bacterium]|nr:M48 family metalloprotease [Planctomycetota bacterium]